MENKEVVVIKEELMEWWKFKKMVSGFTYLEIPAILFSSFAVCGGVFFWAMSAPFDLGKVETQLLLATILLAIVFIVVFIIRSSYLMKSAYTHYMKAPSVLKNELFSLNGGYSFYIASDYNPPREQIDAAVAAYLNKKKECFGNSKKELSELREFLSKDFEIELQGITRPHGRSYGMIVGYGEKREDESEEVLFIFHIQNAKGKSLSLYNLDRIDQLELKDVRVTDW